MANAFRRYKDCYRSIPGAIASLHDADGCKAVALAAMCSCFPAFHLPLGYMALCALHCGALEAELRLVAVGRTCG